MNECDTDKFIFLISSDWCAAFLKAKLNVAQTEYLNIKHVARKVTSQIMNSVPKIPGSSDDYFCIDLSDSRVKKSWEIFNDELADLDISHNVIKKINTLILEKSSLSRDEESAMNAFWMILVDHVDDYIYSAKDIIEQELLTKLKQNIQNTELYTEIDFEKLEQSSESDWDKYLMSIFSGIPTFLSDFMFVKFKLTEEFSCFWINFMSNQPTDFKLNLLNWLQNEFKQLVEEECILPKWLIE